MSLGFFFFFFIFCFEMLVWDNVREGCSMFLAVDRVCNVQDWF